MKYSNPGEAMRRVSIKEIREASSRVHDDVWLLALVRPLGFYLALLFNRLHVSPLAINFANLVLGFAACLGFAFGPVWLNLPCALLLVLWQTLDTADGSLARALKIRSNYGGFIDQLGGLVLLSLIQMSIAVGLYLHPEGLLMERLIENLGKIQGDGIGWVLILGAFSSVLCTLSRLVNSTIQIRFGSSLLQNGPSAVAERGQAMTIIKNLENIGGLQIVGIVLFSLLGLLDVLVIFYFLLNAVCFGGVMTKAIISLRHQHTYLGDKT